MSTKSDPCWVFTGVNTLELQSREVPESCGPYEAVVRPQRTGLCGSDIHIYLTGMIRGEPFKKPFILGHETSGIVTQVGEKVNGLKVGARVALEPGEGCLRCSHCKSGHYAHCDDMRFAAALGRDGTLRGHYTLPADLCYKLPENMSLEDGAMIEPLSVAVQAVAHIAQMRPGSNVAVFGAGPVGILRTVAVAKALGARNVLVVDINADRLAFVKQYAGVETHLSLPAEKGEERVKHSKRQAETMISKLGLHGRNEIDLVIECSGAEPCIQTGLLLLKKRGTLVQVGNGGAITAIPMLTITNRELTIKGSFRYGPGCFEMAIDLVSRGLINLKPLLSHKYSWEDAKLAFETTRKAVGEDGKPAIKVMIDGPVLA